MVGREISHYKTLEKLGAGGMGEVWLADDTKLGRKVALKFLAPNVVSDEELRKRFQREAKAAAGLNSHPTAVALLGTRTAEGARMSGPRISIWARARV